MPLLRELTVVQWPIVLSGNILSPTRKPASVWIDHKARRAYVNMASFAQLTVDSYCSVSLDMHEVRGQERRYRLRHFFASQLDAHTWSVFGLAIAM
jgi:hypothetical protein